jgi:hypothetical protein
MTKPKAETTLYQCIESFVAAGEPETPSYSRGTRPGGQPPGRPEVPAVLCRGLRPRRRGDARAAEALRRRGRDPAVITKGQ